jgi:hypothetical protein
MLASKRKLPVERIDSMQRFIAMLSNLILIAAIAFTETFMTARVDGNSFGTQWAGTLIGRAVPDKTAPYGQGARQKHSSIKWLV